MREFILELDNIYEKNEILDKMEKEESVYCYSDDLNLNYDYTIFIKYINYFGEYFQKISSFELRFHLDLFI